MLAALVVGNAAASAQSSFPERQIQLVVGYAPGGPADIVARLLASKLGDLLGKPVYVENRAGASGNIATEYVGRAAPDGYTLLMATLPNAVNETTFPDFKYRFGKEIVAVAPVADTSLVVVVNQALGAKSVSDLVDLARKDTNGLLYATAGQGTATHLAGELFAQAAHVKLTPVHYKGGGETIKDLLSGQVKLMFSSIPPVVGLIHENKLLALATTGSTRDKTLPDVPTFAEQGLAKVNVSLWYGLAAPAGTPSAVLDKLQNATAKAIQDPQVVEALAKTGYRPMAGDRKDFTAFVAGEVTKWKAVVEASGMTK
jgi:tripartite-type tricarboxylate transporter receptor subunit TctC